MPTHYQILGIPQRANLRDVRDAYHKLARTYHPDVNRDDDAHEKMAQINNAFEVLSDPVRRSEYDSSIGYVANERETRQDLESRPSTVHTTIFRRLRQHETPIYDLGFEPKTGRMVSSSFDNDVFWWNARMEKPASRHRFEGGVVSAISVPGPNHVVAAGSTEQILSCWVYGPDIRHSWRQTPKSWVCSVSPSPDGKLLAYGTVDRTVHVARTTDGYTPTSMHAHEEAVTALAWRRDSGLLATGSADATVRIWDPRSGREIHRIDRVLSTVTSLAFSPDGRWLAVAAVDLSIRIFRMRDLVLAKTFFGHTRPIETIAFHPRNWLLATGSRDGSVGLWNVRLGVGHGQIEASHQPISCVGFSPNGRHLAAGGLDKILRVWRLSTGTD